MSHDPRANERLPRGALVGAAALLGLTLLLAAAGRQSGMGTTANPDSAPVERHALRFEDRPDGGVAVYAAESGVVARVLEPGTNGFVRGVLRSLARERKLRGIGTEPVFVLTRWADGRLSLDDPATEQRVELGVFGPTNAAAFVELLEAARSSASSPSHAGSSSDSPEDPILEEKS